MSNTMEIVGREEIFTSDYQQTKARMRQRCDARAGEVLCTVCIVANYACKQPAGQSPTARRQSTVSTDSSVPAAAASTVLAI